MSNEWLAAAYGGGYVKNDDRWVWTATDPWLKSAWTVAPEPSPPPIASEVRVTFNRGFTWSERETFRSFVEKSNSSHYWINPKTVYIYSVFDSRVLVDKVSDFVAREYLNIHPRAVRTFYPEVIV